MAIAAEQRTDLDTLCINTIRTLSIDAIQKANSGHPGTPMAMAPVAYTLWQRFLRFDPQDPIWPNRDRFVLSAGHASMLLYSLLHLTGVRAVTYDGRVEPESVEPDGGPASVYRKVVDAPTDPGTPQGAGVTVAVVDTGIANLSMRVVF